MLEAILLIIDRLLVIARGRIEGRRQLFREAIEPLFHDLVQVHADYVRVFTEIEKLAGRNTSTPSTTTPSSSFESEGELLKQVRLLLEERRLQFEPVREKLKSSARVLSTEVLPSEEAAFVRAVAAYFRFATECQDTNYTTFLSLLYLLPERSQVVRETRLFLRALRTNWALVTESYATVRVAVAKLH